MAIKEAPKLGFLECCEALAACEATEYVNVLDAEGRLIARVEVRGGHPDAGAALVWKEGLKHGSVKYKLQAIGTDGRPVPSSEIERASYTLSPVAPQQQESQSVVPALSDVLRAQGEGWKGLAAEMQGVIGTLGTALSRVHEETELWRRNCNDQSRLRAEAEATAFSRTLELEQCERNLDRAITFARDITSRYAELLAHAGEPTPWPEIIDAAKTSLAPLAEAGAPLLSILVARMMEQQGQQ